MSPRIAGASGASAATDFGAASCGPTAFLIAPASPVGSGSGAARGGGSGFGSGAAFATGAGLGAGSAFGSALRGGSSTGGRRGLEALAGGLLLGEKGGAPGGPAPIVAPVRQCSGTRALHR